MSDKNNEPFERAAEEGPSREQLGKEYKPALEERARAEAAGDLSLPTTWKDGKTGATTPGQRLHVITADEEEIKVFSDPRANVCGACKYFDLEEGRKEIVRQRFGEVLVRELEWKLRHLGANPDAIGLCGASGGEVAVSFVSKSCDQFRPKRG